MEVYPKRITITMEPGDSCQILLYISETGGMSKLMNTTLEATDLTYNGRKINKFNIQFIDNYFNVEAGSSFFTVVKISVPQDVPGGRYAGKIIVVAGGDVRDECTLIVNIPDELPPQTSILIGSPRFEKDGKIYVNVETRFTLEAVDEGFGLLYTLFKIDEGAWINYSSSFTLAGYTDGHHTVYYFSVDKAGNEETTKARSIILDSTSPTTTCNPEGGTFSERITIILTVTDSGSSVSKTYYRIGEGEWKEYTGPFNITEPGTYTIYYYSIDNLGNKEETKSASFTINPPTFPLFWSTIIITILIAITIGAIALTRRTKKASVVVSKSMSLTINPFL